MSDGMSYWVRICLSFLLFFYGLGPLHLMNFTMDALMRYGRKILGNCLLAYELVFSMSIARRSSWKFRVHSPPVALNPRSQIVSSNCESRLSESSFNQNPLSNPPHLGFQQLHALNTLRALFKLSLN